MIRAAFFDMDRTVLRVNSGTLWVRFLHRNGEITRWQFLRALGWAFQYHVSLLDMESLSQRLAADVEGDREEDMVTKCERWFRDEVEPTISPLARRAIETHRTRGERVVLLTSATPYVAGPLARTLGLDGALCSHLEVKDGRFTGRVVPPLCYGRGKVALAEGWAAREGVDLDASTFYSDSYTDLPMLERVGAPIAVNPDLRLARVARRRGWRVERWDRDPSVEPAHA